MEALLWYLANDRLKSGYLGVVSERVKRRKPLKFLS